MTYFTDGSAPSTSLTKREHLAALALQGFISAEADNEEPLVYEDIAKAAVNAADALIEALNKEK